MDTKGLKEFHDYLKENIPGYLSMLVDGSVAVGDVWVPGESDYDILLIFEYESRDRTLALRSYLRNSAFTDEYLFVPFTKSDYIKTYNNAHDFSREFRTKVLFGEDVTVEGKLPSNEKSQEIYSAGLKTVYTSLEHRLISAEFWSEEKAKEVFHIFFKRAFMYLAIGEYVKTGQYPRTRKLVAQAVNDRSVTDTLYALENRSDISKTVVIKTAEALAGYLESRIASPAILQK